MKNEFLKSLIDPTTIIKKKKTFDEGWATP